MTSRRVYLFMLFALYFGETTHADHWPFFRGPHGDGISAEKDVPTQWNNAQNVVWKTSVPGEGHSSPIVWGNAIFLTTANKDSGERFLVRVDATTGKVLWQKQVLRAPVEPMHRENSPASSTPVTDGQRVYTSFQNGQRVDIQCFDFSGNRIWGAQPLRFAGQHGYSYTPLIVDDLLLFDFSQNDESAVLALARQSGQVRWRFNRRAKEISHVTPLLINAPAGKQVVTCGANEIRSFNPATGTSLWWCDGPTDVSVAGLSHGDQTVFATGGYPKRTRMAVKITGRGDVTSSQVLWSTGREVTYVPSPVYDQAHLFTVLDDGILHCFEAKSGKSVWEHRLGGRFRASLLLANGHIYATNDKGLTTVFRASPTKFEPVAANDLDEICYATPAISNGRIYIRTQNHLYCVGKGTGT